MAVSAAAVSTVAVANAAAEPGPPQHPGSSHGHHHGDCKPGNACHHCNALGVGDGTNTDEHKMRGLASNPPTKLAATKLPDGVCHTDELDGARAVETGPYLDHHEGGSEQEFAAALEAVHRHCRLRREAAEQIVREGRRHPHEVGFEDLAPTFDGHVPPNSVRGSESTAVHVEDSSPIKGTLHAESSSDEGEGHA